MSEPEKKPRRRIKKVKGHGGHHGGAWKVAYADFVTAMMALFLVLWLVSQADTKLKEAIANYFRSPGVFSATDGSILPGPKKVSKAPQTLTTKDEEQTLYVLAEMLKKKFESKANQQGQKGRVKIDVTKDGLHIQLVDKAERVNFPSGSAELTSEAREILAEVAKTICALPNSIMIGGHTDRHTFPANSTYTNWELSADRANAARRALEANCVEPERIHRVIGYADTELLIPGNPYATANRRISILVMRQASDASAGGEKEKEKIEKEFVEEPSGKSGKSSKSEDGDDSHENQSKEEENPKSPAKVKDEHKKDKRHASSEESEIEMMRSKLKSAGSIRVGEPDQLPAGAKRTRATYSKKETHEQ